MTSAPPASAPPASAPPPAASSAVVVFDEFSNSFAKIQHKEATPTQGGGQASYAHYADRHNFVYVQLSKPPKKGESPKLRLPFGISKPYTGKKGQAQVAPNPAYDKRKNVDISLEDKDVEKAMIDFENWNIKDLTANSKTFFDKQWSEAKIREKFTSSLKNDDDDAGEDGGAEEKEKKKDKIKRAARLRTKLNCEGSFVPKVMVMKDDNKMTKGTWNDIDQKGACVLPIVRYSGRYFSSGKWGITWELSNVIIYPRANDQPEFPFVWVGEDAPQLEASSSTTAAPMDEVVADPPVLGDYKFELATE